MTLVDLDTANDGGKEYILGNGKLETAHLYYQALRAAAGSKLPSKDQFWTLKIRILLRV